MGRLENDTDIEKVETVFFKIGKSLTFVPLIAHSILCTQFMFICREVLTGCSSLPGDNEYGRRGGKTLMHARKRRPYRCYLSRCWR